jgi:hypothetical protein
LKTYNISHPITQVRRLISQKRVDEANGIINQISELTLEFIYKCGKKVTAMFPTAIDELIIKEIPQFPFCIPLLVERWPLIENHDKLMYCPHELLPRHPLDIEEIYYDSEGVEGADISREYFSAIGVVINDILKPGIVNHIDSRDHLLVDQSHAICVFRPYFDGNYSTGVSEEILHRTVRYKFKIDKYPKKCIIYCPPDDLAKVRLMELMSRIEEETMHRFTDEDRKKMVSSAKRHSETWFRLRKLKPEAWNGDEIKELFTRASLKVMPKGKIKDSALGKDTGLQYLDFDYSFWNEFTEQMNSHPLEIQEVLLKDVDVWVEEEMSPQDLANLCLEEIEVKKG